MIKPLPEVGISGRSERQIAHSPLPRTRSMAAPTFEVASFLGAADFAWFRTSALTVSLCPGGLHLCQRNQKHKGAMCVGTTYSTSSSKLFSYLTS
jgi:hypothetical protein